MDTTAKPGVSTDLTDKSVSVPSEPLPEAQQEWLAGFEYWKVVDLDNRRSELDGCALQIDDNDKQSVARRRNLRDITREFKKKSNEEKLAGLGPVFKAYQEEIDRLTKRSKYAETGFLSLYKALCDAPDPVNVFVFAMCEEKKVQSLTAELEVVNKALTQQKEKLAEYDEEFTTLKNQDVTVRRLEEEVLALQKKLEEQAADLESKRHEELEDKLEKMKQDFHERELEFLAQIEDGTVALDRAISEHDVTKNQLFEASDKLSRMETASEKGTAMLLEDLDRANALVETLTSEKAELASQVETLQEQALSAVDDQKVIDLQEELVQAKQLLDLTQRELTEEKDNRAAEAEHLNSEIADQAATIRQLQAQNSDLSTQIGLLPSQTAYQKLKRQLQLLQQLEFNVEGDYEDGYDAQPVELTDAETVLYRKNKRLETELTATKVSLSEKGLELDNMAQLLKDTQAALKHQKQLTAKLERDLGSVQGGSWEPLEDWKTPFQTPVKSNKTNTQSEFEDIVAQAASNPSNAKQSEAADVTPDRTRQPSGDNIPDTPAREQAMFMAICGQRDRYKDRVTKLEMEQQTQQDTITKLQLDLNAMKVENVKLYETLKYVQSFGGGASDKAKATDLESGQHRLTYATERKYAKLYEEKENPFKQFKKQQQVARYQRLPINEKITLQVGRFLFSRKAFRSFAFFYALALHLLVFTTLWTHTVRPHC